MKFFSKSNEDENYQKAIAEQVEEYNQLKYLLGDEKFKAYSDMLLRTVTQKMIWAFTTGKDGDNVKNWEDFVKVRGEILARLQPLQEVYGAEAMVEYLNRQLRESYAE